MGTGLIELPGKFCGRSVGSVFHPHFSPHTSGTVLTSLIDNFFNSEEIFIGSINPMFVLTDHTYTTLGLRGGKDSFTPLYFSS